MTIQDLKNTNSIIFECIAGSRAYGLSDQNSDTDIRGVYILPKDKFYSLEYIEQINNETNDIVYYELRKFVELLLKNNPNILELINIPQDCILYKHDLFNYFTNDIFLSKICYKSFVNYAYTQINKAQGLNKKIMNPIPMTKKNILDFCFVIENSKSIPLNEYLNINNLKQENCGLSRINHFKDCYNLYYNVDLEYNGLISDETVNDLKLSHIPKNEKAICILNFNKDSYSQYCKDYKEFRAWELNRNPNRYLNNIQNNKNYDAKNIMHTFRLLEIAKDISLSKTINLRSIHRQFLMDIKYGKFEYDFLIQKAEILKEELKSLYEVSDLQEKPNEILVNQILVEIRKTFYKE